MVSAQQQQPTGAYSDGQRTLQTYSSTLSQSKTFFTALLSSSSSKAWKPVALPPPPAPSPNRPPSPSPAANGKGKEAYTPVVNPAGDVVVHRRSHKGGEVFRAVVDLPAGAGLNLDGFKAVLSTPELRSQWDRIVEGASTVELLSSSTRIVKTAYKLGWPSSPRDTITISQTLPLALTSTSTALLDISASLPRSPADEASYLRPSPPYVRAHVGVLGWLIQFPPSTNDDELATPGAGPSQQKSDSSSSKRIKITCLWQWDPKGSWAVGGSIGFHIPYLVSGLVELVKDYGERVPGLEFVSPPSSPSSSVVFEARPSSASPNSLAGDSSSGAGGSGGEICLSKMDFDLARDTMTLDYSVVAGDEGSPVHKAKQRTSIDSTHSEEGSEVEEEKVDQDEGLERTIECSIPSSQGWRIGVQNRSFPASASTTTLTLDPDTQLPTPSPPNLWSVVAFKNQPSTNPFERITLRITHRPLPALTPALRMRISIERAPSQTGLRLNGIPHPVLEGGDPRGKAHEASTHKAAKRLSKGLSLGAVTETDKDGASLSGFSLRTVESERSVASSITGSDDGRSMANSKDGENKLKPGSREKSVERSVLSLVRRNYIYFTSLLQEPEAKWKPISDFGGVSVHQLDSIDKTLVVYRAEAVFVGVGVWDLLSAISNPGTRAVWDKTYDDATLLDDVNELSELWHWKSKGTWPVAARDNVVLKTTYKSPTSVHLFAFSTDDKSLFPSIPSPEPAVIRTQIDLQGWSIESLSPNTTQVTLVEQSDPKGWSNKSYIPQQMAATLTGIGEFAIKSGGPPVLTRLIWAKTLMSKYDHEKGSFRLEYQAAEWRRATLASGITSAQANGTALTSAGSEEIVQPTRKGSLEIRDGPIPNVECEIRCESETWASSIDVVIDPPPQQVTCLRRHRLSSKGGGSWITIEHDAVLLGQDPVIVVVRRGSSTSSKDKGALYINGVKAKVDVEDLLDADVKVLAKQKRVKPVRIPLDQPPVLGVIRRRHAPEEPILSPVSSPLSTPAATIKNDPLKSPILPAPTSRPKFSSPLIRLWSTGVSSTDVSESSASTASQATIKPTTNSLPPSLPLASALRALQTTQKLHGTSPVAAPDDKGWTLVVEKDGLLIEKKIIAEVSSVQPVYRATRVIEGSTSEEVMNVLSQSKSRKEWDDRQDTSVRLESYGNGCHTDFISMRCTFPFRDRGFYTSSVVARGSEPLPSTPSASPSHDTVPLFHVSASCDLKSLPAFDVAKVNPYGLPGGNVLLDSWVLETLDPYENERYIIPSARCTRFISIDWAGVPAVVNASLNATIPRAILSLESYLKKTKVSPTIRQPSTGLVASLTTKQDQVGPQAWGLAGADAERAVLSSHFDTSDSSFDTSILITPLPMEQEDPFVASATSSPLPGAWHSADASKGLKGTPSLPSLRSSPTTEPIRARTTSTITDISNGKHSVKSDTSSRSTIKASINIMDFGSEIRKSARMKDLVIAEFIIDLKTYPAGYNVTSSAVLAVKDQPQPPTGFQPLDPSATTPAAGLLAPAAIISSDKDLSNSVPKPKETLPLVLDSSFKNIRIPVKAKVTLLPASVVHSASLDATKPQRKHLVRLTIPTSQYEIPVKDPLLHDSKSVVPPKPAWFSQLEQKGAVMNVNIEPLAGEAYDDNEEHNILVIVDGSIVEVGRQRSSSNASFSFTKEISDLGGPNWPKVYPVDATTENDTPDVLPAALCEPIATARNLYPDPPAPKTEDDESTSKSSEEEPTGEGDTDAAEEAPNGDAQLTVVEAETVEQRQPSKPNTHLYNLFASIPRIPSFSNGSSGKHERAGSLNGSSSPSIRLMASPTPESLTTPSFSLATLLVVAIVCLLLGSLMRSFLSPADFIIRLPEDAEGDSAWMEMRRFFHLRRVWAGDDLIVAIVKRPGH